MNRQQLYTLSGVLLASTALAGLAEAATVGNASAANGFGFSTSALKVANTIFSTTTSSADAVNVGGDTAFVVKFSNQFTTSTKFSVEVDVAGANFNTSSIGDIELLVNDLGTGTNTFIAVFSAQPGSGCTAITPLVSKIIIDGCQLGTATTPFTGTTGSGNNASAAAAGILLSGVTFNTANTLASVGNSITLSGSVYNTTNPSQSFESITSGAIITSAAPLTASVSACSNVVASPIATPAAFDYLSTTNLTTSNVLTMCLATVTITSSGALSSNLKPGAFAGIDSVASSVQITVTDTALGSAAVGSVELLNPAGTVLLGGSFLNNGTVANFAGGAATFSLATVGNASNFTVQLAFTGSTPIPAAAAGNVTVAFGKGAVSSLGQAAASGSGNTAQINRGGFNSELNTFLASSNTSFTSFARLHNMGATSGSAQVTVLNDATGAQLGSSFTTATIAAGQTLQLSNEDIEGSAGITAAAGVNYTIQITGPFIGYAQHIIFNPATGQLADLSGFRNHDAGSGNSP
jgi:hypothetical protein